MGGVGGAAVLLLMLVRSGGGEGRWRHELTLGRCRVTARSFWWTRVGIKAQFVGC